MLPPNNKKIIKRAIHEDCLNLIKSYCEVNDPSFKGFCSEWKKMKFHNIFSIIMSDTDMVHTTIEIFYICKRILSQDRPELARIGAVYFLYIIYFKQPAKNFVKIEVSIKTFKSIENFVNSLNESHNQVKFIFLKLLRNEAFRFVENEVYYGLERFLNESNEFNEISFNEFSIRELFKNELLNLTHEAAGNLAAFKLLENNYKEMKKELIMPHEVSAGNLDMSSFFSELSSGMDSIKKTLECKTTKELLGDNAGKDAHSLIKTKKIKIKNKASKKMVESRNKRDKTESETKSDQNTASQNIEQRGKARRFGNRFDEINFLLTETLPSEILKEFGKD